MKNIAFVVTLLTFIIVSKQSNLTGGAKHRCEQYTSIFENDSTDLKYEYCENIGDRRGFTAGRAGFCTATGDAILVVMKYTAHKTINPLARFIPAMSKVSKAGSANISDLKGYCEAWFEAAKDPLFRLIQDIVSDEMYYIPAMKEATKVGINSPLGLCAFYDTIIQHGGGNKADSLQGVIRRAQKSMKKKLVILKENEWILNFLKARRFVLNNPRNKATARGWKQSVGRVDAMVELALKGNWNMIPPIHIRTKAHDKIIN